MTTFDRLYSFAGFMYDKVRVKREKESALENTVSKSVNVIQ